MNDINLLYDKWLSNVTDDDLKQELLDIKGDEDEILDRFYKNLEFGTAGLRGVIGAGTNRMNKYTVGGATQGLALYLNENFDSPSVAIAYDSRIKSDEFAKEAAGVLAANGIKVYIYQTLVPTPMLSFAVRELHCQGGIIITASHNPSKYNGYKCYDPNGYQMTDEAALKTYEFIKKIDVFSQIKSVDFEAALDDGRIEYVKQEVYDKFYSKVLCACLNKDACKSSDLKVIYSPLNGTGNLPVRHILSELGLKKVKVVKSQELPDGNFPTCPYPNPEIAQVFEEGIKMTKDFDADLLLATDPDCDRVGIAVKNGEDYVLMTGNEVGVLLTDYLLTIREKLDKMPENPIVIKSFVTTDLVTKVAKKHGATVENLLTGFKYIGEFITKLEEKNEADRFVVGMEESYGYLSGIHARDKDAVVASALICEMAVFYKAQSKSLLERMNEIYDEFGYTLNMVKSTEFDGASGMEKMSQIMETLRNNPPKEIAKMDVVRFSDYKTSVSIDKLTQKETKITLPKSNVLAFDLKGDCKVIVRPSGTEPKIKIYITAVSKDKESASKIKDELLFDMDKFLN